MMSTISKMFVLSGPSGSGKNTIINRLISIKELNLSYCISTTTREKRHYEKNKIHYYFTSKKKFELMIQKNQLLEHAILLNNYYGVDLKEIERIEKKKLNPILDVDIQGGIHLKKQLADKLISIFVAPSSLEELENRLIKRSSEKEIHIKERIKLASKELKYKYDYDYNIINDDLNTAVSKIQQIIRKVLIF